MRVRFSPAALFKILFMKSDKPKILVICGPTATGKSDLGVFLAKKLNGEIVSADSRQVYKGLDIGSGKITKKEMDGVPHHLLDIVSPKKVFSVHDFQKIAYEAIDDILSRKKIPIIVGGTGFYIQSIVDGLLLPKVKIDKKLRENLEKKTSEELCIILKALSPSRFKTIDKKNKVRLIRAIEIAVAIGIIPKIKKIPKYNSIQLGIDFDDKELKSRIEKRLKKRIDEGMIDEAKKLISQKISHKRLFELGLEYRYLSLFLQKKLTNDEMQKELATKIWQFAKRQRTWLKRDARIKWFLPKEKVSILKFVKSELTK